MKKKKERKLGGQIVCYVMVINPLFVGLTGVLSMEKASGSTAKVSSKLLKNWKSKVLNNISPFSVMFHIPE